MEISTLITDFKDFLLSSFKEGTIAKIIIFGSHTKGEATPSSDIDILIVVSDGLKTEKNLLDRVYEFMVKHNIPIEVVTANVTELLLSPDYFLYNVTRKGEEIYSMRKEELKTIALNDLRNLADEYYESAKEVLSRKRIRLAIDAAYNAAELSAKGLILLKQDDIPGSHGGIVSVFGKLYIATNEIDKEIGQNLNRALKLKNEARYKPNALLTEENAREILNLTKELLNIVDEKINRKKANTFNKNL